MVTDYLGNEIKEGMEVGVIVTQVWSRSVVKQEILEGTGFQMSTHTSTATPCFKINKFFVVERDNKGELFILDKGWDGNFGHYVQRFFTTDDMFSLAQELVAIKGLSDTEEQYNDFLKNHQQ